MKNDQIGMNICLQFYFFIKQCTTSRMPFHQVYGLHPFLLMKYLLPTQSSSIDPILIRVLTSQLFELE
jgi:hypothetical protein